ncbi:MAG: hypothetical protein DMG30_00960 [Acidobacteria bacterium]|nr:MAG: hypothetical protein DMG30_00960 [Acidobacteriota bacterium]
MRNLEKAQANWRPPRPWRSSEDVHMIRRFVWWWLTCRDPSRPSGRAWARELGIGHKWLQKLVREFMADPSEMWRLQATRDDPNFLERSHAREYTAEMKQRGELRLSRREKLIQ